MGLLNIFASKPKLNRYGWKPDVPDFRDFHLKVTAPTTITSIDLTPYCPPVYDQGELGSCSANAIGAAFEFDQMKVNKSWDFMPSRLFIYYNERVMEGTVNSDSGAMIRDGIKTMNVNGVCRESYCPYIISKFAKKPSASAIAEAKYHKALTYQRLDNRGINNLRNCLANGLPFVFGFSVYTSFESQQVATSGIVHMPAPNEQMLGGHAVMAVGFDDSKQMILVRNSWGPSWGLRGYFWMPYAYITNPNLADDFWVIQTISVNSK